MMLKSLVLPASATVCAAALVPAVYAQTASVAPPSGWTTEQSASGVTVYTPSDLKAGEVFKVAIFEPVPLAGKSLEEWLRAFAGPVGGKAGSLTAPLQVTSAQGKVIAGSGTYAGPSGAILGAMFFGISTDADRVYAMRVLSTTEGSLLKRYKVPLKTLQDGMSERAIRKTARAGTTPARRTRTATRASRPAAEVKRYPHVTAPGKGVPSGQIAGILHSTKIAFAGTAANAESEVYLLLKDGTLHKGLPVAPDQLDVASSRRAEPDAWGRWRWAKPGVSVQVALPGESGGFKTADSGILVKPGKSGQRLQGRFGTGSSSSYAFGAGSFRLWGVTFTSDGRFLKDSRGGASGADAIPGTGQVSVNTTYDDNGSYTSASGSGVAVGAGKKRTQKGDRAGTYAINGYVLTLRYDNGQVARLPFFFLDNDLDNLWFEDALLGMDEKKG
ncbi:MAG: hypothetical protein H7Z41_20260 [Cytophagales bacterium]|nr:hypothetical protein [Armatimonadota bacterium]